MEQDKFPKQNIRLLLAITGDDEPSFVAELIEQINDALDAHGLKVTEYESTGDKTRAFELARKCRDYEVFLCTKYLGAKTNENLLSASDIEQIQFLMPKASMIVCTDDQRGSDYLSLLLDKSIYGALLDGDTDIDMIAALMAQPRSRKDAVRYYGISNVSISVVEEGGESESQRVRYISQYFNQKDLENRLAKTFEDATPDEINAVLCAMPDNVLRDIINIEKYSISAGFALSQKRKAKGVDDADAGELKPRQGRFIKNIKPQEKRPVYGKIDVKDICFMSTNHGAGCTYSAILCAYALSSQGYKTALVELNDEESAFEDLHKEVKEELRKKDKKNFGFGGVDYFYRTNFPQMGAVRGQYDFIVYDAGTLSPKEDAANIRGIIKNMSRVFVVTSPMEYRDTFLNEFSSKLDLMDGSKKAAFLVPISQTGDLGRVDIAARGRRVESIPYEISPYNPSRKTRELFNSYIFGEPKRIDHGVKRDIALRLTDKEKEPVTRLSIMLIAIMAAVILISLSMVFTKRAEATVTIKEAESAIADMSSDLERSRKKEENLEAELLGYDTDCCMLVRPQPEGTLIEDEMLREVMIKSDLDKELYLTKDEIVGSYLVTNLENDVPIYRYLIAREAVGKLPSYFYREEPIQKEDTTGEIKADSAAQEETEETEETQETIKAQEP